MAEQVVSGRPPGAAIARPSTPSRFYGFGSVFGKTLRDSRAAIVGVGLLIGLIILATASQVALEFDTVAARRLLAEQMQSLPVIFQGLLGNPINLDTLPGFLSWRIIGFLALPVGIWSILALSGTIAGEAARGSLELTLSTPVSRRRLALQKVAGHVVAITLALTIGAVLTWIASIAFATLPGDELALPTALAEFAMILGISLLAGAIAFALAPVLGRGLAAGIAAGAHFGAYAFNGYAELVPGFDLLRNASPFYWTAGHRPMAGASDWPPVLLVFGLAAVLTMVGVVLFERRDLAATVRLPELRRGGLGALGRGRWSLGGPFTRSLGERLPTGLGWGVGMGLYGVMIALSADSFTEMLDAIPQIRSIFERFYPGVDVNSAGGLLQLAMFGFTSMLVGLAAATLVGGWTSDETEGRLEMVLSTPVRRVGWVLRSGLGVLAASLLMGLIVGGATGLGVAAQGGDVIPIVVGGLLLGLYGAALAGIGLAVGGLGWPGWAAGVVAAVALGSYVIDLFGPVLGLPADVSNFALIRHFGQPMVGQYNEVGIALAVVLAIGGLVVGALAFARRDVRGK
jgi:ABC-2 type transport system permease protein